MMTKIDELRKQLAELDENIKQGQALSDEGYRCGFMVGLTQAIRKRVAMDLEEAERGADTP
jgi:hypothetical protein